MCSSQCCNLLCKELTDDVVGAVHAEEQPLPGGDGGGAAGDVAPEPSEPAPQDSQAAGNTGTAGSSSEVTLGTFRQLLQLLAQQVEDMEALLPAVDVDTVRINVQQLRTDIVPWPKRRLQELHSMLPALSSGGVT
jgi:hypothetical protein